VKWLVSGKNNVLETRAVREPADREAWRTDDSVMTQRGMKRTCGTTLQNK
jgi:hypothetical protein